MRNIDLIKFINYWMSGFDTKANWELIYNTREHVTISVNGEIIKLVIADIERTYKRGEQNGI